MFLRSFEYSDLKLSLEYLLSGMRGGTNERHTYQAMTKIKFWQ